MRAAFQAVQMYMPQDAGRAGATGPVESEGEDSKARLQEHVGSACGCLEEEGEQEAQEARGKRNLGDALALHAEALDGPVAGGQRMLDALGDGACVQVLCHVELRAAESMGSDRAEEVDSGYFQRS